MSKEEAIEKIMDFIYQEVEEWDDWGYCEILEEVSDNCRNSAQCKREEMQND